MRRPATMGDVASLAGVSSQTSVVHGVEQAARDAGYYVSIDLLLAQLEDRPAAPRSLSVPAELVVRHSSTRTRPLRKGPRRST